MVQSALASRNEGNLSHDSNCLVSVRFGELRQGKQGSRNGWNGTLPEMLQSSILLVISELGRPPPSLLQAKVPKAAK